MTDNFDAIDPAEHEYELGMPDTQEVREHIMEWLLGDEKVHALITEIAKLDIEARHGHRGTGAYTSMSNEVVEELICVGQTRFLGMILSECVSHLLG